MKQNLVFWSAVNVIVVAQLVTIATLRTTIVFEFTRAVDDSRVAWLPVFNTGDTIPPIN